MINVGIVGYGNLGKTMLINVLKCKDINCVGVFTRRDPKNIKCSFNKVFNIKDIILFKNKIDILILCLGSAYDLPKYSIELLKNFCIIDTYDNHSEIENYCKKLNEIAICNNTLALVSIGWDPGLFSLIRCLYSSIFFNNRCYTFWGKGVSEGHSNVLRHIDGVKKAIQYTIPRKKTMRKIIKNKLNNISSFDLHKRLCYIVMERGKNKREIIKTIKGTPNYFNGYKTKIKFLSEKKFVKKIQTFHCGKSIINGKNNTYNFSMVFEAKMDSNPDFTSLIMIAYLRALYRLKIEGKTGAITVLDIPIGYLLDKSNIILKEIL